MELTHLHSFSELLGLLKASKRRGSGAYSFNELAAKLGYRSPRALAMVCKRQRSPSAQLVRQICDYLELTPQERDFVFWLAEKARLEKKGVSTLAVDLKIERFKGMRQSPMDSVRELPGVKIEIGPLTPEPVRRRLEDCVRELAYEYGSLRTNQLAKEDSALARTLDEDCPPESDRDPCCPAPVSKPVRK